MGMVVTRISFDSCESVFRKIGKPLVDAICYAGLQYMFAGNVFIVLMTPLLNTASYLRSEKSLSDLLTIENRV